MVLGVEISINDGVENGAGLELLLGRYHTTFMSL